MKVGEVLAGRYELREVLGNGRGTLFLAHDRRTARSVAVKVFDTAHASPTDLQRYAARLVSATAISHPAVVLPQVEVAISGSPPFVAGELLQGEDLTSLCARIRPVPSPRALAIAHACAEGLAALAVASGAAHRALRPGNVWLATGGQAQILDFGIAELGAPPSRPRQDGSFVEYRAPEQLEGAPGDARSDVFSLGVLLFEMATGVHPFAGPSAAAVAINILMQPAPAPSRIAPHVPLPSSVAALLSRALARRPKDRIPDAAVLARELAALLPAAPPPDAAAPMDRPPIIVAPTHASQPPLALGSKPSLGLASRPVRVDAREVMDVPSEVTFRDGRRELANQLLADRTLILPQLDRPGKHPDGDDDRTLSWPRPEGRRPIPSEEQTLALPKGGTGSVGDDDRTLALPRGSWPSRESAVQDDHTLALPGVPGRGEMTEMLPLVSDAHAPSRTGESPPLKIPSKGQVREEAAQDDEQTPARAANIQKPAHSRDLRAIIALNLILAAIVSASIIWLWLRR